jgi:hypothetical protein
MSRQQFSSRNNIGKIFTFQKSGSTASFDPTIIFTGGRRASWRLNNGTTIEQIAGNSLVYTGFSSDPLIRTIELRGGNFVGINQLFLDNDNLFGSVDLSVFENGFISSITTQFNCSNNPGITAITNPISSENFVGYTAFNCNITGALDMSPMSGNISSFAINNNTNLTSITFSNNTKITSLFNASSCNLIGGLNASFFSGTNFQVQTNNKLTGITHAPLSQNISQYIARSCNLIGALDLTPLTSLGGNFQVQNNSGLTSIIHAPSVNNFTFYSAFDCNLTGNLDLSMLHGLGGNFSVYSNPNLTGINHTYSLNNFNGYNSFSCNLIGNLDVSTFPNLGGTFRVNANPNLTTITHTASTNSFSEYSVSSCGLIGNHDISMLSNIGGEISIQNNTLLTGITFTTASTLGVRIFNISVCNIPGTIDLTPFTGFGATLSGNVSQIKINANSGLTSFVFPESNGLYYRNPGNNILNAAFGMYACSLGYVDFKPLSGSTLISGATSGIPRFEFFGNGMTTAEVNHILSDFDTISSLNYSGWTSTSGTSGAYVDISSNSAPDGSSGGYNGTGATINLISKGWTIITD